MDQSSQSLNHIAENMCKVEALTALIADILSKELERAKLMIAKDESHQPSAIIMPPKAKVSGHVRREPRQLQRIVKAPYNRKSARSSQNALPVSPGLFYRYDREEIYKKVWERPLDQIAKEYELSPDTFRKTCERLWIPFPRRAYFAMKAASKPVAPAPPLPTVEVIRKKRGSGIGA